MRNAACVYTAQPDIVRLQALIGQLPNDLRVQLTLDDGRVFAGVVAARQVTVQYFDPQGREGTNGVVRLEPPALAAPGQARWGDLLLHQIVEVRPLDRHELDARPAADVSDSPGMDPRRP